MLRQYINTTIRLFVKNKVYSSINILGIATAFISYPLLLGLFRLLISKRKILVKLSEEQV